MDSFKKHKIEKVLNKVIALVFVIAFFGWFPRELQNTAPTVFALASILVYTTIKSVLNYFSEKSHTKEVLEELRKEMKEIKEKKEIFD